ncbi:MAG TPA: methylenetetrahydrofolate reductase, partial [Solirubrobacteraceae bacterium]|nr:methylenetetrahydrofolate reductase [Solirubrobacteraceae bacterium]
GQRVITAEMPAIDGGGLTEVRRQLAPMQEWLDAVNATDNTAAHAHASPLAVAIALKQCGVEPIMQLVCRDRNRLALQADIVGAAMHGIENLVALTGDDVTAGDEPEARRVFDLDSPQLIALASMLAEGRYLSGRPLEPAPRLFVGAVENPAAPPVEFRVERALMKARAGARFLQLQIGYRPEVLEDFVAAAERTGLTDRAALIPSITILRTASALRFIDTKVAGIEVPAAIIERVEAAADQQAACFELAHELASHALSLPGVAGLHFISFRKDAGIAKLCTQLGLEPRIEREKSHAYAHDSVVAL